MGLPIWRRFSFAFRLTNCRRFSLTVGCKVVGSAEEFFVLERPSTVSNEHRVFPEAVRTRFPFLYLVFVYYFIVFIQFLNKSWIAHAGHDISTLEEWLHDSVHACLSNELITVHHPYGTYALRGWWELGFWDFVYVRCAQRGFENMPFCICTIWMSPEHVHVITWWWVWLNCQCLF